jgi:hypothetical protein
VFLIFYFFRNGAISYIQIIKRDQTRPPVRPVCRKLGVSKLSEIKSESDLYEALVCVAQGQAQKARELEVSSQQFDQDSTLDFVPKPITVQNMGNQFANFVPSNQTPRDDIESLPDLKALVDCILSIRVSWDPRDRYQRLDMYSYKFGIDEMFLLNALNRICEIIGCSNLSPQIDTEVVKNAVKVFYRQHYARNKYGNIEAEYQNKPYQNDSCRYDISQTQPSRMVNSSNPVTMLQINKVNEVSPRYVNDDISARINTLKSDKYSSSSVSVPNQYNYSSKSSRSTLSEGMNSYREYFSSKSSSFDLTSNESYGSTPREFESISSKSNNFSVNQLLSSNKTNISYSPRFYSLGESFWDIVFGIFRSITNPDTKFHENLAKLLGILIKIFKKILIIFFV